MLTYTGSRTLFGDLTNNDETPNLTFGDTMINEGIQMMLGDIAWPFLENQRTQATVDGQQFYDLPADVDKIVSVTVVVGTTKYRPRQLFSFDQWDFVNSAQNVEANQPSYFFVYQNTFGLWPIPNSADGTITVTYKRKVRDISVADYTTGTITTIANGGTAVTGSGTSWNASMVGRYIRITYSNAANVGDGLWYEIEAVGGATSLTLARPYLGTAITAGSAAYTIGDVMIIPEKYQKGPVYYAAAEYWRKNGDVPRTDRFENMYAKLMVQMVEEYSQKTTDYVIDEGDSLSAPNPNNYVNQVI